MLDQRVSRKEGNGNPHVFQQSLTVCLDLNYADTLSMSWVRGEHTLKRIMHCTRAEKMLCWFNTSWNGFFSHFVIYCRSYFCFRLRGSVQGCVWTLVTHPEHMVGSSAGYLVWLVPKANTVRPASSPSVPAVWRKTDRKTPVFVTLWMREIVQVLSGQEELCMSRKQEKETCEQRWLACESVTHSDESVSGWPVIAQGNLAHPSRPVLPSL